MLGLVNIPDFLFQSKNDLSQMMNPEMEGGGRGRKGECPSLRGGLVQDDDGGLGSSLVDEEDEELCFFFLSANTQSSRRVGAVLGTKEDGMGWRSDGHQDGSKPGHDGFFDLTSW